MGEKRGMQALEAWCRKITSGYPGVNITNMTSSWRNGLGFCAIIHHFRPDLIDFESLSPNDVYKNNEMAFTIAEQHLGIPALLDPEDMVEYQVPDRLSILTYLSQLYRTFAAQSNKDGSPRNPLKRPVPDHAPQTTPSGPSEKIFARQFQTPTDRRHDNCVICNNPVFLAERLILDRKLFHRTCFRCARCKAQLSIANCYETEQGQFCCETCPDEEEHIVESKVEQVVPTHLVDRPDPQPRPISRLAELKAKFEVVTPRNQAAANFIRQSFVEEVPVAAHVPTIPESVKPVSQHDEKVVEVDLVPSVAEASVSVEISVSQPEQQETLPETTSSNSETPFFLPAEPEDLASNPALSSKQLLVASPDSTEISAQELTVDSVEKASGNELDVASVNSGSSVITEVNLKSPQEVSKPSGAEAEVEEVREILLGRQKDNN